MEKLCLNVLVTTKCDKNSFGHLPLKMKIFMSLEKDNKLKYLMNNCIKQVAYLIHGRNAEIYYMLLHKSMKVICYSNTVVL